MLQLIKISVDPDLWPRIDGAVKSTTFSSGQLKQNLIDAFMDPSERFASLQHTDTVQRKLGERADVFIRRAKNIFNMLVVVFFVMIGIKVLILLLFKLGFGNPTLVILKKFFAMSKIECMTTGGMGAFFLFKNPEKFKSIVYHPAILPLSLIAIPFLILFTPAIVQDGIHLVYSVLFLLIIANVSGNPNSFLKLENRVYNFLGKISYSIYMYHFMLIPAMFYLFKKIGIEPSNEFMPQLLMYTVITGVSILVSWLSFTYFEGWFLRLKSKYTIIMFKHAFVLFFFFNCFLGSPFNADFVAPSA
jgi:peptidoglycan/LPS O-acetylase OafA/YrhL